MTAISPQDYARASRRLRWFVLVWIFLTLFIGFATFMAIYFTYIPASSVAVEPITPAVGAASIALQTTLLATNTATVTPQPTGTPLPTNVPTSAATATETPLPPTPLPVSDKRFQVGIQIATSPDMRSSPRSAVEIAKTSSKLIKMERTGPAKDFVQRAAIYLRYIPAKGDRVHPAFINTHNYLTCAEKADKKWVVEGVSRVDFDKSSGIAIYAFFFTRPECEAPVFHMEAVTAES